MDSQAWAFLFTAKWRTFNVYRDVYNYVLISLIIVGNLLTLIALVRCRHLHVQRNWLIGSLCLADIVVAVTCAVTTLLTGRDVWDLRVTAMNVAFFISLFHVIIIAADRFIAITVPLRYFTIVTKRSIIMMIVIAWLVPALVLIPVYEVTSLQGQMTNGRYYVHLANHVVNIIMSILLIGTIVVLYGKILKETRSHVRRINMVKPITNTELCETKWTSETRTQRASNQETLQTRNQGISKEEEPQARNQKTSNQEMPGASNQGLPNQEIPQTKNQATSTQETKVTWKQGTSNQVAPGARNQITSNQVAPGVRNQGTSNQVAPGARNQGTSNQVAPGARNQITSNQVAPGARNQITSNQVAPGVRNQITSNQVAPGARNQITSNQVAPGARNQITSNQVAPGVRNQITSNQVAPGTRNQITSNQVTPGARNQGISKQGAPQASKKGTRLILTLVITISTFNAPYAIVSYFLLFGNLTPETSYYFAAIAFQFLLANSAVNILVYAVFSCSFRKAYKELMCCLCRGNPK